MVKSRRTRKTLPATTHCFSPSRLHAQEDIREGVAAVPMITEDLPAGERPRPPTRSPGCHRVRDELSKLTRLGSVLNYSDEQSSNNGDDDDVEPTSSASEMPFLSRPSSSSPDPGHQGPSATHPDAFDRAHLTAPESVTGFKETIARSVSASDAALAFQRWRISSLKMEALQMDLVKALERATSSEAEVERYNKEIRKLRERLKSTEDEAGRLDSELKATVSFLQKEKDGVTKENQVLLEQLARKDEEVLAQAQEINTLKSMLACLRVSQLDLERLKNELQGPCVQRMKSATLETLASGNVVLQSQAELKNESSEASADMEEQSLPTGHVLRQLLEVLQKLTVCLHNNEAQLEASGGKIATSKEKYAVRSDLPQKGTGSLEDTADFKTIDCAGQGSPSLQLNNGFLKDSQFSSCTNHSVKERKLFAVTCWKWRWVVAASSLQALSKENKLLKSVNDDKRGSVQQSSFLSCLEKFQATLINQYSKTTQEPSLDLQAPVSFDKLFVLLTSIWKLSSQSAHQEKEAFCKGKQLDHLLRIMTRWMQRALKKRQLERVITHWLRYLLQSWKDKFKLQSNAVLPLKQINYQILSPKDASNSASHVQNSTSLKTRDAEKLLIRTSKGPQNLSKDAHICKDRALLTLQESLHKRLEDLEASIMKEASHWHQQHVGKGDKESTSTNLVWVLYSEMERSFSEARNQIMTHFGVFNKVPVCYVMETKGNASAFSPKPLTQIKVGICKKPAERHSSVQAIARKRKQIFI